jgi:hypothetical protein
MEILRLFHDNILAYFIFNREERWEDGHEYWIKTSLNGGKYITTEKDNFILLERLRKTIRIMRKQAAWKLAPIPPKYNFTSLTLHQNRHWVFIYVFVYMCN